MGSILLDLYKAFDLVNHDLLIKMLNMYTIDSALFYRINKTAVNNLTIPVQYPVHTVSLPGVPQGSLLGPHLFLIYINDLPLSLNNSSANLFADDTPINVTDCSIHTVVQSLTNDITNIQSWCDANLMTLNISKTKVMYMSSRHKHHNINISDTHIYIYKSTVTVSPNETFLK